MSYQKWSFIVTRVNTFGSMYTLKGHHTPLRIPSLLKTKPQPLSLNTNQTRSSPDTSVQYKSYQYTKWRVRNTHTIRWIWCVGSPTGTRLVVQVRAEFAVESVEGCSASLRAIIWCALADCVLISAASIAWLARRPLVPSVRKPAVFPRAVESINRSFFFSGLSFVCLLFRDGIMHLARHGVLEAPVTLMWCLDSEDLFR